MTVLLIWIININLLLKYLPVFGQQITLRSQPAREHLLVSREHPHASQRIEGFTADFRFDHRTKRGVVYYFRGDTAASGKEEEEHSFSVPACAAHTFSSLQGFYCISNVWCSHMFVCFVGELIFQPVFASFAFLSWDF